MSQNIPPASPPPPQATDANLSNKINLADVIIAAAAAKTVKLKSKGKDFDFDKWHPAVIYMQKKFLSQLMKM